MATLSGYVTNEVSGPVLLSRWVSPYLALEHRCLGIKLLSGLRVNKSNRECCMSLGGFRTPVKSRHGQFGSRRPVRRLIGVCIDHKLQTGFIPAREVDS